jgi:membrane dipeptidase
MSSHSQTSAASKLHEEAIVIDGHVHITERVFHEGIDPWKAQETGLFDYARARQGGLDVVIHALYLEDSYNRYN